LRNSKENDEFDPAIIVQQVFGTVHFYGVGEGGWGGWWDFIDSSGL